MQEIDSTGTTQLLGETTVAVEIVVGRARLTLDDLARMVPGQILSLDRAVGDPVDVVAHGTTVARAELVDVEGRLGVRLLSMEPR